MMRFGRHHNRPTGRSNDALRQYRSRAAALRPGASLRAHSPYRLNPGALWRRWARRLGPWTLRKAILAGAVVLVCVCVPVVLVANAAARARTAELRGPAPVVLATGNGDQGSAPAGSGGGAEPTDALAGGEASVSATVAPQATPTPQPHPTNTVIRNGTTAPVVAEIQARLMKLGYMDEDEPTEYFGPVTSAAIALFQRQHKLSVDGSVGMETYTLLMSDEAQKYTVMEGDSGSDVRDLQERLRQLGYLDDVTGRFGEQTTKAVKTFQQYNGLTADGKVGIKTFDLLYSAEVKPYFLKYGEQSDKVKTYQKRLNSLGYLISQPDGKYGNDTVAAVKRFQDINGLISDGFLGSSTVSLLMSSKAHVNALVLGMQGKDVQSAQARLKALGYMSQQATGYFGSATEEAVKAFQKRNGLSVDGTVGQQTLAKLNSSGAKRASTGSSGSSGGTGGSGSSGGGTATAKGVDKLIALAQSKLGKSYVWGAKGPNSFDCSGFIYYCLNQSGVKQGYLTSSGWASTSRYQKITSISSLKRGDIVVFSGTSVGHVGIYLGNGVMIDASSSHGKVVKRTGIWNGTYWKKAFISGFRVY